MIVFAGNFSKTGLLIGLWKTGFTKAQTSFFPLMFFSEQIEHRFYRIEGGKRDL